MSFATGRSQLQQLQRSTLQQRGTGGGIPSQWWEWITIRKVAARNPLTFPFTDAQWPALTDPGVTASDLSLIPYSILHPDLADEANWPTFAPKRNLLRSYDPNFPTPRDSFNEAVDSFFPNVIAGNGLAIGGMVRGDPPASAYPYPLLPTFKNPIPPPPIAQYSIQFDRQATMWAWDLSTDTGAISLLYFQKARYKWNITSAGFMIRADIWARKQGADGTFGWLRDEFGLHGHDWYGAGRFSFENVSLYRSYRTTPRETFIEVPVDFPAQENPLYSAGFVGRGIFAIDFETPEQWSARTGIVIH